MRLYFGNIPSVLACGEFDSGDAVQVSYDDLFVLQEQATMAFEMLTDAQKREVERRSNRKLGGYNDDWLPL